MLLLFAVCALHAQEFPFQPVNYVTDVSNIISQEQEDLFNTQLLSLKDSTGVEVAVVTLDDIGNTAPVDMAVNIGRTWGVGAVGEIGAFERNAGVVFLVVPKTIKSTGNKGHCFIAVGRGAEGWLTDMRAGRLCREAVNRGFRAGNYEAGISFVLSSIINEAYEAFLEASKTPEQRAAEAALRKERKDRIIATIVYVLLICSFLAVVIGFLIKLLSIWRQKNSKIETLNERISHLRKEVDDAYSHNRELVKKLTRFTYPTMSPKEFEAYYNKEDKKEKERLRKLEEARKAKEEAERKEREYWASPEGQAELKQREIKRKQEEEERRKRQQKKEEERKRRNRMHSYYNSNNSSRGGGGFGGFGGGGGFSGGGGGKSW